MLGRALLVLSVGVTSCRTPPSASDPSVVPTPSANAIPSTTSSATPTAPRDEGPWENPFVVAVADGLLLNGGGGVDAPAAHIRVSELKDKINALPASAWKRGKQVGLQRMGIVSRSDEAKIDANFQEADRVLTSMGLDVVLFPTN